MTAPAGGPARSLHAGQTHLWSRWPRQHSSGPDARRLVHIPVQGHGHLGVWADTRTLVYTALVYVRTHHIQKKTAVFKKAETFGTDFDALFLLLNELAANHQNICNFRPAGLSLCLGITWYVTNPTRA